MSIVPVNQNGFANHSLNEPTGKYSSSAPSIAKKITTLALGLFAIHVASNVPTAEAGFGFFTWCMSICLGATAGFGVPACAAACAASLATPTP